MPGGEGGGLIKKKSGENVLIGRVWGIKGNASVGLRDTRLGCDITCTPAGYFADGKVGSAPGFCLAASVVALLGKLANTGRHWIPGRTRF